MKYAASRSAHCDQSLGSSSPPLTRFVNLSQNTLSGGLYAAMIGNQPVVIPYLAAEGPMFLRPQQNTCA